MVSFQDFLLTEYFGNTGQDFLIALAIFIGVFIILKLFDSSIIAFIKRTTRKTKFKWDDVIVDFISAIHWIFYSYLSFYIAARYLEISDTVSKILDVLLLIFIVFYAAKGLSRVVDHFTKEQIKKRKEKDNVQNTSMIKTFGVIFKIIIFSIAILMVLSNLGIEITPLIASLGIGGIAIAIALQAVLADLFAAFSIYFDKPFKEGDFIIIGSDMGTIKNIGIKTTRIQSLQGQELIVSNSELTSTRVNNYAKMKERRVAFSIGVEYSTPHKKLTKINDIVEKIIKSNKDVRFDRCHFKSFGDFSLNFEIVYYVKVPDYVKFMDVQQDINFKLAEAFEKERIIFAFPTQTIHVDSFKKK